nr:60 kda non-collagenous phosphoprotein {N-terminal} [chickens, 10-14 week old, bone powder, Peptide Partial, 18 aa] [Gallus gallus]
DDPSVFDSLGGRHSEGTS